MTHGREKACFIDQGDFNTKAPIPFELRAGAEYKINALNTLSFDVAVTGRDGRPVADLTAADFELLVDGEPTPILNFYEGHRAEWGQPGEQGEDDAEVPESPLPPPEDQRLYIVVFIDNTSIRARADLLITTSFRTWYWPMISPRVIPSRAGTARPSPLRMSIDVIATSGRGLACWPSIVVFVVPTQDCVGFFTRCRRAPSRWHDLRARDSEH